MGMFSQYPGKRTPDDLKEEEEEELGPRADGRLQRLCCGCVVCVCVCVTFMHVETR